MKKSVVLSVVALILCASLAQAQQRDPAMVDHRNGPPVFGPLGGGGAICNSPGLPFGAAPTTVQDTINVAGQAGAVSGLEVELQISHTWVGDIVADVEHDGTTVLLLDQPGVPAISACGCSSDDVDAVLSDGGSSPAENACSPAPPALGGTLTPAQSLSAFDGDDPNGDWTLTVTDSVPTFDSGSFNSWCVNFGGGAGTTGGTPTPATSTWGVIALITLFLGAAMYYLRRRASATA